jgi:hypothetical protein
MNFILRIINLLTKREPVVNNNEHRPAAYINYSDYYNNDADFKDHFYENLRKTIAFTEQIISKIKDVSSINYGTILRTTNPIYLGRPFYTFYENSYLVSSSIDSFDYTAILSAGLSVRENIHLPDKNLEELGKILKFEIDICLYDGAPCSENGFVDESDIPPIDTWFYITKKYLYCWIPTLFIGPMQDVIDVKALASYTWLEEADPELNRQVFKILKLHNESPGL